MRLTPFTADDIEACLDLFIAVFNRPPWNDTWTTETARDNLEDAFGIPGASGLVARESSEVIGFVLGHREVQSDDVLFYVKELCVSLEYQGRGVGRQLLIRLEEELKRQNVAGIYLLTFADSARMFYEKLGFRVNNRNIVMNKNLS